MITLVALITMTVTIYCPGAGWPNGSNAMIGADYRHGQQVRDGEAACGFRYPFGTTFVVLDAQGLDKIGARRRVICRDRGEWIGPRSLDIVLMGGRKMLPLARAWGKRRRQVMVFRDLATYQQTCANLKRLGESVDFCEVR